MTLRRYWHIVLRRLWVVLAVLLAALLSFVLRGPEPPPYYTAAMRFVVGVKPEARSDAYFGYDRYYTWLTAEYLLDDLSEVTKSRAFAADVASIAGLAVPVGAIQGATASGKLHRILTINVTWPNEQELERIADAIVRVLGDRGSTYFAQLGTEDAVISLIDPPAISVLGRSLRDRLDLPIRALLALAIGVAVTFLLDYLDDSLRDRADVDALGLPLLVAIPDRRRCLRRWLQRRPAP